MGVPTAGLVADGPDRGFGPPIARRASRTTTDLACRVRDFEAQFYRFLETERPKILTTLAAEKALSDEIAGQLDEAIEAFRTSFLA